MIFLRLPGKEHDFQFRLGWYFDNNRAARKATQREHHEKNIHAFNIPENAMGPER